jgi:hypothetical protein
LPKADYYPLLAVLQIDMSEENLSVVVAEFLDGETVVIANDAAKAASVLVPSSHDIIRVRSRLEAAGWSPELDEPRPLASRAPSRQRWARSLPMSEPRCAPRATSAASSSGPTAKRVRIRAPLGRATTNGSAIGRSLVVMAVPSWLAAVRPSKCREESLGEG